MEILLPLVLVLIALAAPRYGSDSRWPAPGEPPHPLHRSTVRGDLTALRRLAGASHVPHARRPV